MIRVHACSRLHFGILSFAHGAGRQFGGVGLMVRDPGVALSVEPATAWSAEGPLADRALEFTQGFAATVPSIAPQRIRIEECAPDHAGLGTGTQLGLAVARALAVVGGLPRLDAPELARRVGRGQRSALGIHGFDQGGFLVEAGKRPGESIAPLAVRVAFPDDWRIVLIMPAWGKGLAGHEERQAFQQLPASAPVHTDRLCRLVLLEMLPALAERDLAAFGDALYDFNRLVGEAFAPVQGGTYASARHAELVGFIREQGVHGVAQSSWGPTVAVIVGDEAAARDLANRVRGRFGLEAAQVIVTVAGNRGARLD